MFDSRSAFWAGLAGSCARPRPHPSRVLAGDGEGAWSSQTRPIPSRSERAKGTDPPPATLGHLPLDALRVLPYLSEAGSGDSASRATPVVAAPGSPAGSLTTRSGLRPRAEGFCSQLAALPRAASVPAPAGSGSCRLQPRSEPQLPPPPPPAPLHGARTHPRRYLHAGGGVRQGLPKITQRCSLPSHGFLKKEAGFHRCCIPRCLSSREGTAGLATPLAPPGGHSGCWFVCLEGKEKFIYFYMK